MEIPLHRVTDGVAEIQDLPLAVVKFVFLHHPCFLQYAVEDDFFHMTVQIRFRFQGFKNFKKFPVSDAAVLHRFRQSVMDVAGGKSLQQVRVDEDPFGLVEGAGQVFPLGRSTATLPPTELSIWANMVVGIWKKGIPLM